MTGINVIGMPFGLHGLGLELRDKVRAMVAAGIDVCIIDQNYSSLKRQLRDPDIDALVTTRPKHHVNLICHNLPATGLIARKTPELLDGHYNIGAPYWEFPQLPDSHRAGLDVLDELWVSNSFLKTCFTPHTDKPVLTLPLHLQAGPSRMAGWGHGKRKPLVFGYVLDFNSMAARKDPMLLLIAFLESFADKPKANVRLVIKYSVEPSRLVRQRDVDEFLALAAQDPRIEVIGTPLSQPDMDALTNSFDVYISPHRAEGLGRGIVEAMMKGKAVAATSYSGPAEFLSPDHAVPLDHYQTHVGAAALGDIKSHFTWVDARLEAVMDAFKLFADTPALASRYGQAARKALTATHGAERHGQACKARLAEISG